MARAIPDPTRAEPARAWRPRGTGREIPALLACLVWAGGFEIAPLLHALDHGEQAPHTHGWHPHDADDHHHDEPMGEGAPDPEHGEGSLAHRDLAAHTAPPALPPLRALWLGDVDTRQERPTRLDAPARERPRARAPPGR